MKQPLRRVPNSLVIALLVIALLGFADAGYLTVEHYKNVIPPCSIVSGCEKVLTSEFSTVAGVPVSLGGAIYYFLVLVGSFAYLEGKNAKLLKLALILIILGFLATLWFFYLQAFVLHSFCLYCLGSAASTLILFILTLVIFSKYGGGEASVAAPAVNSTGNGLQ